MIPIIFALGIESIILIFILLILIIGVLGIFLPFLPGLVLFGIAAGVYSLLIKSNYGIITPKIHRHFIFNRDKFFGLKITKKIMGLIKNFKSRKKEKVKEEILKNGMILLGFNLALVFAFFFGFIFVSLLGSLLAVEGTLAAFIPLVVIFVFAGGSTLVWFRFGQILSPHFKKKKVLNSALIVLISILPLLVILILFSAILSISGGFTSEILVITFLGFLLMSVLAAVFELLVVSFGVMTTIK